MSEDVSSHSSWSFSR